jgi:excisionase family DNA binding protein
MTTTRSRSPLVPDAEDASAANEALQQLKGFLATHRDASVVTLRVDDDAFVVPREAAELFARVLAHMAAGEGVTVLPAHAELTTQQAADILNVSRPYLIKLLECGAVEFRLVGKHRRIRLESLMRYMREDDRKRRQAADELSSLTQDMGLV